MLRKVHFDPQSDELWCVGDLVNRGPESLETLRFLKAMGDACICVLGNHDLHLLAVAANPEEHSNDSLAPILEAPDCDELIDWLRFRPMLHHDAELGWAMVHAGLHPHWTLEKAKRRAAAVEKRLRGEKWKKFCLKLLGKEFPVREPARNEKGRARFVTAVLTRSRYCTSEGRFDWKTRVGGPRGPRERPWFAFDRAAWSHDSCVVFGHWAAMGLVLDQRHVLGLDSGCVWGGSLTLAELGRHGHFSIVATHACTGYRKPHHRADVMARLES